jgi:hypothetical protein
MTVFKLCFESKESVVSCGTIGELQTALSIFLPSLYCQDLLFYVCSFGQDLQMIEIQSHARDESVESLSIVHGSTLHVIFPTKSKARKKQAGEVKDEAEAALPGLSIPTFWTFFAAKGYETNESKNQQTPGNSEGESSQLLNYWDIHFSELVLEEGFFACNEASVAALLARNSLVAASEMSVLEAAYAWAKRASGKDGPLLLSDFGLLLTAVRLPLLTATELVQCAAMLAPALLLDLFTYRGV